ncbi:IRC2 [Saccharomyces cerevisiae synthetic construct]|uniref:Putative uncharacterized membrane protein IRC2 n=2 Tax=Saccharomyces cerevisiae TaxID=4932 RepID=IRC2_YEAST|nr:RecName: Full=Putative uncharacterized membrane protein IRC2; AltName: Full=Increased recombination centers protein 2 [Saccharomyces cerevisiae S288C]AHX39259.1 IRC2 [Saccharomyces cerevisiae]WNF19927.1 IRC2 [Saccharomyces cerevisiae synthetic construct]CAY78617.1 Irc2p [Saccharomyces cerevisiae EC1118]KZV12351.1 hypothetical protein WN66_01178 [Saccharomyces cerevisiae]QHB07575.1 hypothetical protein SCEN_D03520 [Saccharomyces cerevisiae]
MFALIISSKGKTSGFFFNSSFSSSALVGIAPLTAYSALVTPVFKSFLVILPAGLKSKSFAVNTPFKSCWCVIVMCSYFFCVYHLQKQHYCGAPSLYSYLLCL